MVATTDGLGNNSFLTVLPLDSVEAGVREDTEVHNSKGKRVPPSAVPFDSKGYTQYQRKSLESKREYLKNEWLDVTYLSLAKAKLLARSVTKKDFGRLVQILTSAGIAYDKVFPKDSPLVGNMVVNLFKGLPQEKVLRVLGPSVQPCEGKPLEETSP
jgi:hypothetical protein